MKSVLCSLLSIIACVLPLFAQNAKQPKKEFQALYKERAEASESRNVDRMLDYTTADYLVKLSNGQTMTRQQLEARLRTYFDSGQLVKQLKFSNTIKSVQIDGDTAIVVVEQEDKRIQIRSDGKPHEIEANVIHKDTWVRQGGTWKLKLTEEGEQTKFTVDGEAVKPK